jgi:hypothetical protein
MQLMGNYDRPYPLSPAADQQRKPLSDSGNSLQPAARLADLEGVQFMEEHTAQRQQVSAGPTTWVSEFG